MCNIVHSTDVPLFKIFQTSFLQFSDCYYRSSLIDALSNTITAAVAMVNTSVENLSPETKVSCFSWPFSSSPTPHLSSSSSFSSFPSLPLLLPFLSSFLHNSSCSSMPLLSSFPCVYFPFLPIPLIFIMMIITHFLYSAFLVWETHKAFYSVLLTPGQWIQY